MWILIFLGRIVNALGEALVVKSTNECSAGTVLSPHTSPVERDARIELDSIELGAIELDTADAADRVRR
jgi:hypothetical protein